MNASVSKPVETPDNVALNSAIGNALLAACQEQFGGTLRALILTGSAARNELTARREGEHMRLLSDVEAVVVLHDSAPLPPAAVTQAVARAAEQRLAPRALAHVGLSVVHARYLCTLPPAIYSFELRSCGRLLFGGAEVLEMIPHFRPTELSREDAWRLLSNRLVELLEEAPSVEARHYRVAKLCLDLATSLLVFAGEYVAGYSARLEKVETLARQGGVIALPIALEQLLPVLVCCTRAKLRPGASCEIEAAMAAQIEQWAWRTWLWELRAVAPRTEVDSPEEQLRVLGRAYGGARRLRGWLFAARRTGWLRSVRYWPRWAVLFARDFTPRHAVYLATWVLGPGKGTDEANTRRRVSSLVPIAQHRLAPAAQVCWNYKEFVTETRA